jgi:hypothetical protein
MISLQVGGIASFIVLILDIWAIVNIFKSGLSVGLTVIWILVILILPFLGFILWFLFGPKAKTS